MHLHRLHLVTPTISLTRNLLPQVNVLISDDGAACLSDFGLSRILQTSGFTTKNVAGTYRWMALELLDPVVRDDGESDCLATTASDVWALAMTILEVSQHSNLARTSIAPSPVTIPSIHMSYSVPNLLGVNV